MSFLHPEFLYLMLPPLFILFGLLLTQKEAEADFFSKEVLQKLRVSANILTLKARNALFFLIGFLLILALAQPVIPDQEVEVTAKSADVMLALDISDSMLAADVYPNRLEFAKLKANELLKIAANEHVGVIAFAKNSYLVSPLSFDTNAVRFLLQKLSVSSMTEQGTNFLSLLEVMAKSFEKEEKKYLLILSDGGDQEDFSKEIAHAKKHGITVFVLGFGTEKGAPVQDKNGAFIKDENNQIMISKRNDTIAELATQTGGVYVASAKSHKDIETIYQEIKRTSDPKELKTQKIQKYIPLFYFPVGLALLILLLATSSMSKRESVSVPAVVILLGLLSFPWHAEALVLDFLELKEAKKAYEQGDYDKAAQLYSSHADATQNSHSRYNAANALYKQGKYEEAIEHYKKTRFSDKKLDAKNYANLGNAHAKSQDPEGLKKALESYENSLKLVEDAQVRENMQRVKALLEKQKEEQEGVSEEEQQDTSNEENQENKQNSQKNQNGDEDPSDAQNNDTKENQNEQENKENEQENKQEENDSKADSNKENEEKNSMQNEASEELETAFEMSEEEMQKWLSRLNEKSTTYMYKLNQDTPSKEDTNGKPW